MAVRRRQWLIFGGSLVALSAALIVAGVALRWLPAHKLTEEVIGVDSWSSHRSFFGDRIVEQSIVARGPTLSRVDVLVVDLKRGSPGSEIILELVDDADGSVVREVRVAGANVRDDYYLPFAFEPIARAAGRKFTIRLLARAATGEAPFAVRLTEDKQSIAWRQYTAVSQWFIARQWIKEYREEVVTFAALVAGSVFLAWIIPCSIESRRWAWVLAGVVVLSGMALQGWLIPQLHGDAGGDVYYYLVAAKQISEGMNPLADWSYRLPFYPALLIPAVWPSVPDLLWGRLVGVGITLGVVGALVLLARELRRPAAMGLLAAAWLYSNTAFVVTSLRPRPYAFFGLLLLLSCALLWRIKSLRQAANWGALLGVMGMTRQEAYVPIMILGAGYAAMLIARRWRPREIGKYLLAAAVPLLLIVSPYFVANYRDEGTILPSSYFRRSDLPLPTSWHEFWNVNVARARHSLGTAWLPSTQPSLREGMVLKLAMAVFILGSLRWRWWAGSALSIMAASGIGVLIIRWLFFNGSSWTQDINVVIMAAMVVGAGELIRLARWRGVLLVAVAASQILIATFFHPAPKHYQQVYPWMALASVVALVAPVSALPRWKQSLRLLPIVLLLAFLSAANFEKFENAIDDQNYPAAPYFAMTEAAEELEHYPAGAVAAEVDYADDEGVWRLHSYQQRKHLRFEEALAVADQKQWLCQNNIRYIIDHDDLMLFTVHEGPDWSAAFIKLFEKRAYGRDSRLFRTRVFETSKTFC